MKPSNARRPGNKRLQEACPTYSLNSGTISTQAFTFSTGVSGRMPWPTLKMCPGRVPVRFSSSAIFIFSSGNGANRPPGPGCLAPPSDIADVRPRAEVNHRHAGGADALDEGARIGLHEAHVIVLRARQTVCI